MQAAMCQVCTALHMKDRDFATWRLWVLGLDTVLTHDASKSKPTFFLPVMF